MTDMRKTKLKYITCSPEETRKLGGKIAGALKSGDIVTLKGGLGSGKTTFIRMLCGLLVPDAGTGACLGYDVRTQQAEIKRRVGYMTQRFSFYEDLSIRELAEHKIWVNAIAPGGIATPGATRKSPDATAVPEEQVKAMTEAFLTKIPMHRMGEADEIGKVALFLASDMSSYMTGEQVVVDGGVLLN